MSDEKRSKTGPSRRAIVGWTAGMFAALAAAAVGGRLASSVRLTRRVLEEESRHAGVMARGSVRPSERDAIKRLGGHREASGRIDLYLRLPPVLLSQSYQPFAG